MPFNQAIADYLCERISTSSHSLHKITREAPSELGMVSLPTIMKWLDENPSFVKQYARAKDLQADYMAEETLDIADDGTRDYGKGGVNFDHIARARLRVDTRKWAAAHLRPKKYGTRVLNELTGADGGPITTRNADDLSDADLAAIATAGRPAPVEPEEGED